VSRRWIGTSNRGIAPFPNHFEHTFIPSDHRHLVAYGLAQAAAAELLVTHLKELDMIFQFDTATWTGYGFSKGNVWSRFARREKKRRDNEKQQKGEQHEMKKTVDMNSATFGFRIQISEIGTVEIDWLKGNDWKVWDTFSVMIARLVQKIRSDALNHRVGEPMVIEYKNID
jgi:hypothetical protein